MGMPADDAMNAADDYLVLILKAGLGTWQGSGMVFGKDGRETTGFTIELRRTAVDERSTETKGTVVLSRATTRARLSKAGAGPGVVLRCRPVATASGTGTSSATTATRFPATDESFARGGCSAIRGTTRLVRPGESPSSSSTVGRRSLYSAWPRRRFSSMRASTTLAAPARRSLAAAHCLSRSSHAPRTSGLLS